MSKHLAALSLGILLALLPLVGCGEDDGDSPMISKAVFVKKASAICSETNAKASSEGIKVLRRLESDGASGQDPEAALVTEWLVPTIQTEIDELRALGTPDGDEERVDAILVALQDVIDRADADPERYLSEQVNFEHPYKEVEKLATAYGISECGQP